MPVRQLSLIDVTAIVLGPGQWALLFYVVDVRDFIREPALVLDDGPQRIAAAHDHLFQPAHVFLAGVALGGDELLQLIQRLALVLLQSRFLRVPLGQPGLDARVNRVVPVGACLKQLLIGAAPLVFAFAATVRGFAVEFEFLYDEIVDGGLPLLAAVLQRRGDAGIQIVAAAVEAHDEIASVAVRTDEFARYRVDVALDPLDEQLDQSRGIGLVVYVGVEVEVPVFAANELRARPTDNLIFLGLIDVLVFFLNGFDFLEKGRALVAREGRAGAAHVIDLGVQRRLEIGAQNIDVAGGIVELGDARTQVLGVVESQLIRRFNRGNQVIDLDGVEQGQQRFARQARAPLSATLVDILVHFLLPGKASDFLFAVVLLLEGVFLLRRSVFQLLFDFAVGVEFPLGGGKSPATLDDALPVGGVLLFIGFVEVSPQVVANVRGFLKVKVGGLRLEMGGVVRQPDRKQKGQGCRRDARQESSVRALSRGRVCFVLLACVHVMLWSPVVRRGILNLSTSGTRKARGLRFRGRGLSRFGCDE